MTATGFAKKNRHGPPTSGFFIVPRIYFDPEKEKMPSSSNLEQRKFFFKLTGKDLWRWFLIKNRIMITRAKEKSENSVFMYDIARNEIKLIL